MTNGRNLTEKYRPKTWNEVTGQDAAICQIATAVKVGGIGGQGWFILGKTGTGKTTIARLLAQELAAEYYWQEFDVSTCQPAKLREVERDFHLSAPAPGGRAIIINEAQGLHKDMLGQLLVMVERLPEHTTIIFTAMVPEDELFAEMADVRQAEALVGRCQLVALESGQETRIAFAERAREIAVQENLNGQPPEAYVELIDRCRGSMRRALQEIAAGKMYQPTT